MLAVNTLYMMAGPNGRQIEQVGKLGKKVVQGLARGGDDVARQVAKDPSFFSSIPTWVWIVLGIVALGALIYWIDENS